MKLIKSVGSTPLEVPDCLDSLESRGQVNISNLIITWLSKMQDPKRMSSEKHTTQWGKQFNIIRKNEEPSSIYFKASFTGKETGELVIYRKKKLAIILNPGNRFIFS